MHGKTDNAPDEIGRSCQKEIGDEVLQGLAYIMREAKGRSRLTFEQVAEITGYQVGRIRDLLDGRAKDAKVLEVSEVVAACGCRLASSIAAFDMGPVPPWHLYRVVHVKAGVDSGRVLGVVQLLPTWQDDEVLCELEAQLFLERLTPKTTLSKIVVRVSNTNCYSMQVNEDQRAILRLDYVGTLNSVVPTVREGSR